jgi:hypothetical protein
MESDEGRRPVLRDQGERALRARGRRDGVRIRHALSIGDVDVFIRPGRAVCRGLWIRGGSPVKGAERAGMRKGVMPLTFQCMFPLNAKEAAGRARALATMV